MPRPARLLGALVAAAAIATTLNPAAQAAAHRPSVVQAHAKMASAAPDIRHVTGATSEGIVPDWTATAEPNEGLTFGFDATKSADSNPGDTITGYSFAFGDGNSTTTTTGTASYTYSAPGTYTVTLTVTDSAGNTASAATTVTTAGSDYTPDGPTRILDTRSGTGAAEGAVGSGDTIAVQVSGVDGVPTDATAAVLNLTVTSTTTSGNVSVYPDGITEPVSSNPNFAAGGTVPDLVTVLIGTDGKIAFTVNGTTSTTAQLVGDLEGYYSPTDADSYTSILPGRVLDTRSGLGAAEGTVGYGKTVSLAIDGASAVTSGSSTANTTTEALPSTGIIAVALNLTVTNTTNTGVLVAYADGSSEPTTSNLNYTTGQTIADAAIVPVGADGKIDLTVTGQTDTSTDLIADVEGYYTAGDGSGTSVFVPVAPARIYDTRKIPDQAIPAGGYLHAIDGGIGAINAYALNVTVVSPVDGGSLIVRPDDEPNLDNITSTLNFGAGEAYANFAQATASSTGVDIYNNSGGTVQIVIDEFGYFATQ